MTIRTREEHAVVTYDACDSCGATLRLEATIGDERFDPRSRSGGWHILRLWRDHPWHGKHLCHGCRAKGAHLVEPVEVAGMVRIKIYDVDRCEACEGAGCSRECVLETRCQQGWVYNDGRPMVPAAPPSSSDVSHWSSALLRRGGALAYLGPERPGERAVADPAELVQHRKWGRFGRLAKDNLSVTVREIMKPLVGVENVAHGSPMPIGAPQHEGEGRKSPGVDGGLPAGVPPMGIAVRLIVPDIVQ